MSPAAAEQNAGRRTSVAGELASFVAALEMGDIPSGTREKAKLRLLDTVGAIVASVDVPSAAAVHDVAAAMGGRAESGVLGYGTRLPAPLAALVNGTLAHAQDYDDTHAESVTHASAPTFAAALAVAEREGSTGAEMLVAAIAGAETTIRLGFAAPNAFNARGFHATAICGAFGAAAAAGKLLRLDAEQLMAAFGIVGSQAAGIIEFVHDGTTVKHLHPGWAAHAGVLAALFAQRGLTGPTTVLEGPYGLYRSHLDAAPFDLSLALEDLGRRWRQDDVAIKLYPACHHAHGHIDAILDLRRSEGLEADQVSEITCHVPSAAVAAICEPFESKLAPSTPQAARFSLPFCVAGALIAGHALPGLFTERWIHDPAVVALARRVRYAEDPDARFPAAYGGAVDVRLLDGRVLRKRVPVARGGPENPASLDDVSRKFEANAERLPLDARKELYAAVLLIETARGLDGLVRLSAVPETRPRTSGD